jgi:hypothetical protein
MNIPLERFTVQNDGTLVTEASIIKDITFDDIPTRFEVDGLWFGFVKEDIDRSGEGTLAWQFRSEHGRKCVIINA